MGPLSQNAVFALVQLGYVMPGPGSPWHSCDVIPRARIMVRSGIWQRIVVNIVLRAKYFDGGIMGNSENRKLSSIEDCVMGWRLSVGLAQIRRF